MSNLYTCPCCGYKTLNEKAGGTFEICPVCFWEDDPEQFEDPEYVGGANGGVSLRQAQKNFLELGACSEDMVDKVRKPKDYDKKDPNFKLIGEPE